MGALMKKTLLVGFFALAGATPSFAADAVLADPVVEAPAAYDWSGIYVGVHGGYGWADSEGTFDSGGPPGGVYDISDFDIDGGILGAHAGYNWQWNQFVVGIEGDLSWSGLEDRLEGVADPADTVHIEGEVELLASIRARLGYAFDNLLFYGTVGAGYADFDFTSTFAPLVGTDTVSDDDWGVVFGGGVEYGWNSWLFRLEALHYDVDPGFTFDGDEVPDADGGDTVYLDGITTVRLGVSYKF